MLCPSVNVCITRPVDSLEEYKVEKARDRRNQKGQINLKSKFFNALMVFKEVSSYEKDAKRIMKSMK